MKFLFFFQRDMSLFSHIWDISRPMFSSQGRDIYIGATRPLAPLLQHVMKWTLMTHGKYLTSCPLITVYGILTLQLKKGSKSGERAHAPAVPKLENTLTRLIITIESDVTVFVLITVTPGIVKYLLHGWFVFFLGGVCCLCCCDAVVELSW